ncbi:MAG: hypothetical protein RLZZ324_1224, partial [Candidatus Parcubacteria bacterium]
RLIKDGLVERDVALQYIVGNEDLGEEEEAPAKKKKGW